MTLIQGNLLIKLIWKYVLVLLKHHLKKDIPYHKDMGFSGILEEGQIIPMFSRKKSVIS